MALTDAEVAEVKKISVSSKDVESLKGIELFTALTSLDCGFNKITSLDVSKNTELTMLDCSFNALTSIDVSKNTALTGLVLLRQPAYLSRCIEEYAAAISGDRPKPDKGCGDGCSC